MKDETRKLNLYEKHGVGEYWIVNPIEKTVTVRVLGPDLRFGPPAASQSDGLVEVTVIPGLVIDLEPVFVEVVG